MRVPLVTDVEIGQHVVSMVEESLAVLPGAPAAAIPATVAAHGVALGALVGVPAALAANTAALAALAGLPAAVAANTAALAALAGVPVALAALAGLPAAVAANTAALAALAAKFANSLAVDEADLLTPVADALGAPVPGIFPATRGAFHALSAANCDVLLAYYRAPIPPAAILVRPRRALLRPHLGLTRVHID